MPTAAGVSTAGVRIGIDVGGTFTDLVLCLPDQTIFVNKTSTTPADPGEGVIQGLQSVLKAAGVAPAHVGEIVHGTTVASNTILQKSGARTGVLATKGFRDVLEIARIRTPGMFDLAWDKPEPLAPRRYRLEVTERIAADGAIVTPLVEADVIAAGRRFAAEGVASVAIAFINSYANPAHEIAAERLLRAHFPALLVTASTSVLPEMKEYERTSTTVVNAYILPAMQAYLRRLSERLVAIGITAPLQVMASNGGMIGGAQAASKPVYAVASGPAGGVTGAARLGAVRGDKDLIVFDMGGTTAKAAIIENGEPLLTTEYEFRDGITSPSRFIKGGGYMLKVPSIDIAEVGSGGGSIAEIDAGGLLMVGPKSAGADPGPACYGRGNDKPTVTDANMVLGYLNPVALAGGSLAVLPARSEAAVLGHVARRLGLDAVAAAHGIRQVANVNMARAIRSVTIERGRDPRGMTLMAFGGMGPAHAVDVARLLGIARIVVPAAPGVFAALGMLAADVEHDFVKAVLRPLDGLDMERVRRVADELRHNGEAMLRAEGYEATEMEFAYLADLRYVGQSSDLSVPLPAALIAGGSDPAVLAAGFAREYRATFGYVNDEPVELVNLRLMARGRRQNRLDFKAIKLDPLSLHGSAGTRPVSFTRAEGFVDATLLARSALGGQSIAGPAIIESYDSTIAVPPGATARVDVAGSVLIELDR
jgi:N-methylhydantoinase A